MMRYWLFDPDEAEYDNPPREGLTPDETWEWDEDEEEGTLPDPRCTVCGYPSAVGRPLCTDCDDAEAATFIPLHEAMRDP